MPEPLTITNFGGPLTRKNTGDINSGLAKFDTSWGYDPYSKPGNLTWLEQPTSIMTTVGGAAFLLVNHNAVVLATNYQSSLFQITVAPLTDVVSVVGTVTTGPGAFTRGLGAVKYGAATERLFVGGDEGIGRVNLNDFASSVLSDGVSGFNTGVPRPMAVFLGKTYFGNGNNIGEIDSTNLIITTAKLSPALPQNTYVADLDVSPDGNYLIITANETITNTTGFDGVYTSETANRVGSSFRLYWNGIDNSISALNKYDSFSATANASFTDKNYLFGQDAGGSAVFNENVKVLSFPKLRPPSSRASLSVSNMLTFAAPEYDDTDGRLKTAIFQYGQYDTDIAPGLFRLLKQGAQVRDDISAVPTYLNASNLLYTPSAVGLANNQGGVSKLYYTTLEINGTGVSNRTGKMWKFSLNPTGLGSVVAGVYETQNQIFSKKVKLGEIRFYTEPLVADNIFTLAVLNSGSSIIAQNTYTVGGNVTAGEDLIRFKPEIAPTQAVGFRITNSGSKNWTGLKLEADYMEGGS